jgi:hypothetical protein
MKVTDVYQDLIVVRFGDHTHSFTVEQLAYLVRHAYWRMDWHSSGYLAQIVADALTSPPIEVNDETWQAHRSSGITRELARAIKAHNRQRKPTSEGQAEEQPVENTESGEEVQQDASS